MALLSIVVPVYNVSRYLKEGLDSLLNQSVEDVEIICVDDKSTDDSLLVLSECAAKDVRVKVVRMDKNSGPSSARNMGIEIATGKYITFFDPDDIVSNDMYKKMIDEAEKYDADIVQCAYQTYPDGNQVYAGFPSNQLMHPCEYIGYVSNLNSSSNLCFSWRFVFKTRIIEESRVRYNENVRIGEDAAFNFRMMMNARNIIYVPECLYYYRVNNMNSAMKKKYNPWMESSLQLQIADKKKVVEDFDVDKYTPFTKDMNEDIVKRYTMMMFHNLRPEDKRTGVRRILNMPMVKDAFDFVGYRNIYPSMKEYCFFLMMKWRMYRIVEKYV